MSDKKIKCSGFLGTDNFTNGIKKNTIYMLIKSAKRRLQKCILRRGTRIIKT